MTILQQVATDAGTISNTTASAAVTGVSLAGMGLPDWVAIISGGYFLISAAILVLRYFAWRRDRKCFEKGLLEQPPRWG